MTHRPQYAELADGPEYERIAIIGTKAEQGYEVAFVVEDDEKADRYVMKLLRSYNVAVTWRGRGPVPDTVMVKVKGPRQ